MNTMGLVVHLRKMLLVWILLLASTVRNVHGITYSIEVSPDKTWADEGTSGGTTQTVTVRSYVPGSNSITYRNINIYTPTYSSDSNVHGDVVGTVYTIYGSGNTAWADPFDGPRVSVIYPATQISHTKLFTVNDDRLALGIYHVLGGHARGRGFFYDLIYDQYTDFFVPGAEWTAPNDLNNMGRIVGANITANGATRRGFTYDCENGFEPFDIPASTGWTVPSKIDDQGVIYGSVSGIPGASYFIATPDVNSALDCSLVRRNDVAEPVLYSAGYSFEMSGDVAAGVKIGDFNGEGCDDLLIYHEQGKTILYYGESDFDSKLRFNGNEFNTLGADMNLRFPTEWDCNGDGVMDNIDGNKLYLGKPDGSYYYVPQILPGTNPMIGDFNGDGKMDLVVFSGGWATVFYQENPNPPAPPPAPAPAPAPEPAPTTAPGSTPAPGPVETVPTKFDHGEEVEFIDVIDTVFDNRVVLTSDDVLWFDADTVVKLNDVPELVAGLRLECKAWDNLDGHLIGIKVEVMEGRRLRHGAK